VSRHLAFDLGASSGRGILGELGDDDRLIVSEVHRFTNGMVEAGGHLRWDIGKLLTEIHEGMRKCRKPDSIGIDTWGVDYALLDSKGTLLESPYAYRDKRTEGAVKTFAEKMPLDELYRRTGIQLVTFDTLFQLVAAARDEPEALGSASRLLMIGDLFNYRLTDAASNEFTLATTSHLYNPYTSGWDEEIIATVGAPRRLFGEIVKPGTILGDLTKDARDSTGLGRVPVVAVACHDTGSAVAAVPAEGSDFAYISSGTWSLMGIESPRPIINKASYRYNITNEGGVRNTYRVLKNIAGLWLVQECRRSWGEGYSYDELTRLAEAAKPHVAVIDPDWHGFLHPHSMPKAITDFCTKTGQKPPSSQGEMIRVSLEGLALAYRYTLAQLEEASGRRIAKIHIVGGGARNRLLNQLAADSTGRRVYAGPSEATSVGNVLVQSMAGGRVKDLHHIRKIVSDSTEVEEYAPGDTSQWDEAYEKLVELKEKMT
jgi:sugar (pentulose or hexulose) kinase